MRLAERTRRSTPRRSPHHPGGDRGRPTRPRVEKLVAMVARATLEVLAGRRPVRQLADLVSPAVYQRIEARLPAPPGARRGPVAEVKHASTSWPTAGACEATVLVRTSGRTTALALRAQRHGAGWRIVEIAAPEDNLPPIHT